MLGGFFLIFNDTEKSFFCVFEKQNRRGRGMGNGKREMVLGTQILGK